MISQAGWWTQTPSATPLQPIKWNASFWIMFTSDDWPGWLRDSNPICHLFPAKKMKCSLLDYVHFGWSARLVNGLKPHPPPLSSQKKWNAHFWIMFNFWWSAGLVNGLEPHLPPLSYQKNEMLIFRIHSTSDDQPGWSMDSNPICHPSPTKKMKFSFLDYVQLLMLARLVNGLKPHPPPVSSQKNEIIFFVLHWTSDDQPGWLMDSNPTCHPCLAKNMKCSFLDFVQLLMISQAGQWIQTPSTTPLHPKKWNAHFCITFNFWWSVGLVDGLEPHTPPVSSQKMKCSYFDFVKLLMIGRAVQRTRTPSTTPLQPKKWNAHFWVMFNFW